MNRYKPKDAAYEKRAKALARRKRYRRSVKGREMRQRECKKWHLKRAGVAVIAVRRHVLGG